MIKKNLLDIILSNKKIKHIVSNCQKIHIIAGFFFIFWIIIIWKMFSYTVINYDFYKALADKQQIWEVIVPVTRWKIYSWWDNNTILWTSLNLYDLAIDPQMEWDKTQLVYFLQDLVYKQICLLKSSKDCKNNLLKYLKVLDIEDFENSETFVKKKLYERLSERLSQTKVTSVFINKELDISQINSVINMWLSWIYPSWSFIYANPEEISDANAVAEKLWPIIWIEKEQLSNLLRKRELRYIPIINRLSISVSQYLKDYLDDEKEAISKWVLDPKNSINKFFILSPKANRFYPENNLASQVIGFVDNDWKWHYWIEWYFDDLLKWNNWKIVSRKDVLWRIINPISLEKSDLVWEWVSIKTTIDRNIQKKVEEILEEGVKKYRANKWTIIVMEPKTWNVVSMVNYPNYDLNNFWDVYELEKVKYSQYPNPTIDLLWYPIYVEDSVNWEKFIYDNKEIYLREALREELWDMTLVKYKYKNGYWAQVYKNDAISSLYEPWSIMKAITVAIWLDTWEITENSMYKDDWKVSIWEFTIENVSKECLWYNTFLNALNFSCNIWMIRIVQRVWKVLMHEYYENFWFWEITKINLSWEISWKLSPWERWSTSQLLTSSYWLWISITPIQMAVAYSILVNWWVYIEPNIIDKIEFPNWKIIKYKAEQRRRVIKESTSKTIIDMLVDWVNNWVASVWWVKWYNIGWKTWTSQISFRWWYETWEWSTVWSYAWFWPAEDPKFVVIVKLDRPRAWWGYWWNTSSHIFKEVTEFLLNYYWIPKKEEVDN